LSQKAVEAEIVLGRTGRVTDAGNLTPPYLQSAVTRRKIGVIAFMKGIATAPVGAGSTEDGQGPPKLPTLV
jgi:hypothetical protein